MSNLQTDTLTEKGREIFVQIIRSKFGVMRYNKCPEKYSSIREWEEAEAENIVDMFYPRDFRDGNSTQGGEEHTSRCSNLIRPGNECKRGVFE